VHNGTTLDTGELVTAELVRRLIDEESAAIRDRADPDAKEAAQLDTARRLFEQVALADDYADFLTLPAYDVITKRTGG
jgi:malate synthase